MPPRSPRKKSSRRQAGKSAAKPMTYADVGVSIEAGDEMVGRIERHMRRTYGPRVLGQHGAFAGLFRLDYNEELFTRNYKDPVLVSCADGVGTKVKIAAAMNQFDTLGQDLVAMNVNDLVVQGAEPLFFLDYLAVHKLDPQQAEQIVKGVADGCVMADCALLGGETAEMPDVYPQGEFDMAGFAVGVAELRRVLDGSRVEPGDIILGLHSSGVHSNGFSLVRAIIDQANLKLDQVYPELDPQRSLGQVLLTPTRIYTKAIVSVLRAYRVKQVISGMAHITGGGLPGNVNRALGQDVDAKIRKEAWVIPPVFEFLKLHGQVAQKEMFNVFNMGIGFVVIVRPPFAESVKKRLTKAGETVSVLGKVTEGTGHVKWA